MYRFLTELHKLITGNHAPSVSNKTHPTGFSLIDFPLNLCEDAMLENSSVHTRVSVHVNNLNKYFDDFHSRTNVIQILQTKYDECLEKLTVILNERTELIEKFNACSVVVDEHKKYTFRELIDLPFDDLDPIYVHQSFFEDACTARLEMFYYIINFSKNTEKIIDLETCLSACALVEHSRMIANETCVQVQSLQCVKLENTKREQRKNIRKTLKCG